MFADKTSAVTADKTSVVSADKTSVVSADKTSVVSQDIPPSLSAQGWPLRGRLYVHNAWGMFRETPDALSADTTDVLSADATDVLSADTFPPDFAPSSPKWFSAITCNILWLRVEYRPLDSAWFFGTPL